VVRSHIDEAAIATDVVDAEWIRPGHLRARKIVPFHVPGVLRGTPLLPGIREIPDQFLPLGIDRDDRELLGQAPFHRVIDVVELGIAVRMIAAFFGLAIALQAVLEVVEQVRHLHVADGMMPLLQRPRNRTRALARPSQRRVGIAPCIGFDHGFQRADDPWVRGRNRFAACTGSANATRRQRHASLDFANALEDGLARQARRPMHERDTAMPDGHGLRGGHQTPRAFVQERPHRLELCRQLGKADHALAG